MLFFDFKAYLTWWPKRVDYTRDLEDLGREQSVYLFMLNLISPFAFGDREDLKIVSKIDLLQRFNLRVSINRKEILIYSPLPPPVCAVGVFLCGFAAFVYLCKRVSLNSCSELQISNLNSKANLTK